MTRNHIFLILLFFTFCRCGTNMEERNKELTDPNAPIVVAMTPGTPGCFAVGDQRYGYPYELLCAFAREKGRELEVITGKTVPYILNDQSYNADIIVALSSENRGGALSLPLYSTNYVALAPKGKAAQYRREGISALSLGGSVMVASGFEGTKNYDTLLDSLSQSQIYVTPQRASELAGMLARGECELLICEKSEALSAMASLKGISQVHEFSEKVDICLIFGNTNARSLEPDFSGWLQEYCQTADYLALHQSYYGEGKRRPGGTISAWDDVLRRVGTKEGIDWRLLSAIAYKESRFNMDAVSKAGACGIMQVMPVVARQFRLDEKALRDPETNITVAAKLIKKIEKTLNLPATVSQDDRLCLILASYNSGIGTVTNARRLAVAHGENPDSWQVVSKYLRLMGDDAFDCEDVSYRRFNGSGETLAFVDGVVQKYNSYRKMTGI